MPAEGYTVWGGRGGHETQQQHRRECSACSSRGWGGRGWLQCQPTQLNQPTQLTCSRVRPPSWEEASSHACCAAEKPLMRPPETTGRPADVEGERSEVDMSSCLS